MHTLIKIIIGIALLAGAAMGVKALIEYYGRGSSTADFAALLDESGVAVNNVSCSEILKNRMAVCRFHFSPDQWAGLVKHFALSSDQADKDRMNEAALGKDAPDDLKNINGMAIFTQDQGQQDPCDFQRKIHQGYQWMNAAWRPARNGTSIVTYSGAAFLYHPDTGDACIMLQVAYG